MVVTIAARRRAAAWSASWRTAACASLLVAATAGAASAQNAATILNKATAAYTGAKSFSGTVTINQSGSSGGKTGTRTTTQQVRYKAPNMFRVDITAIGTGAADTKGSHQYAVISDGHSVYRWDPANKRYVKQPAPPTLPLEALLTGLVPRLPPPGPTYPTLTLLPAANVAGHPAYVVQIQPKLPPNMPAAQRAQLGSMSVRYFIDRATYHVVRVLSNMGKMNLSVDAPSQSVNGAVASNVFSFTPPAGAKEIKPQVAPPQGPGGAAPPLPTPPGGH